MLIFSVLLKIDNIFVCFNARHYVCSIKITSNQSSDDADLRKFLTETNVSGQSFSGAVATTRFVPLIGPKDLNSCMTEEFKLIIMLIKHISKCE